MGAFRSIIIHPQEDAGIQNFQINHNPFSFSDSSDLLSDAEQQSSVCAFGIILFGCF